MAFNLTAQLNIALNSASLRNASNQLNSALNTNTQIKLGIDRNSSSGLNQIKSQISEATDSMENFGRQAGFAAKRFAAFAVTAGSIIAFTNTMKEAVSAAVDFDREMVRLRQVSSDTVQDVGAVGDQVTNLSKNLGVSSKDLIGVAVVLKQANLTLSETKDALEAMAQAALAPNFDNLKDTTEGAIAIMKQFKVEAKDLGAALGSVNAVAGEFAVEASDIIEAIRKTGGAFKAAGGQLNELIALFTSVRQTTRESAESIGTGLRTIFTRIQRNDTANALKEVGINLRYTAEEARALGDAGLEQQFVGPYEAVKRLSAGLSELRSTDPRFSAIVEQLGGYRQISKVIPLIQEFATAQKALGVAQAGSVSLAVNAGQAQDALAVKLQKLKESFFEVGRSIVNSPGFRSLADTFIGAATSVLSLINSLKGLLPLFTALAAVKIGQGLGSFATGFVKGAGADSSSVRTARKADGGFLKMRKGGIVPGSGSGDKVPALLEPGELVVPRSQVVRQKFNQINQPGEAGEVKQKKIYNSYGKKNLGTHFTHLDLGTKPLGKKPQYIKGYSNFGIDLPANWNTDWATPANNVGVGKGYFTNYIKNHDVFATYKGKNLNDKNKKNPNIKTYKINRNIRNSFNDPKIEENAKNILIEALSNNKNTFYDTDIEVAKTFGPALQKIKDLNPKKLTGIKENVALKVIKTSKSGNTYAARVPVKKSLSAGITQPISQEEWEIEASKKIASWKKNKKSNNEQIFDAANARDYHLALGGPIPRQRFMEGKEVRSQSEFLKNTFRPGYPALKDALKESGSLRYLRPIQSFAGRKGAFTLPFEILASSNDKDFWAETEGNLGKRKTDQFRRFYETKKLIEIEQKKYGDERRAKNPLALPEANPKYSEALQASIQKQEESQNRRIAKSFYAYKEDYDKNNTGSTQERKEREIYVSKTMGSFSPSTGVSRVFRKPENFDPKEERDTLKHERIHAIQKDSLRSDSPLKNSFFNTAGQQSESSLTPGKQTFLAEVQANYGAKSNPSDKRKAALEFAASKYDATTYASQYHMDIANRIGMPKFDRSVIRAERHRKNIYREGFDNPEVIAANKALGEIIDKQPKTRKNKEKNKDWMEKLEEAQRILEEARTNARGPNWQKRLDAATEISRNKDSEQMSRQIALSAELYQKLAFGGSVNRQRFMEGEEVTHRKSFLDNSFNPGMKLKSALQDTPRIIFKRQPKEYEKFPNMDHTSPHFEQFSEMFVGSRKASQFKRAVEYQRLYQEALKNNDVESANKYDKLNKLPANMRLLAAAKALPSAQEKARTNSFEDGNFDYEKNLLVNYSGKKTTTRHELGAHAAAYGASKEGSPLANSLFGSIGRRMGAYGKGSGETTLISEMQAHTIQSAKQKDKINSLKEFISSEKMAKLYKSEAHGTLADSMQKGSEIPTAGVLGGRHKDIEIDVLKRMMQDAYGDNPEVLAEKMSLLNPSDSSNRVNFGALFADSKETKRYAFGGNVGRQMFADGDKATAKPQSFEEFSKSLNPKQLADFKEKIKSAKQIIVNARTSGSMKLKSVGFNFLGTKFNMIPNKDLADKGTIKSKDEKPTYDLKGVKSLDELLSKLPPKHSEDLRAKIGRAQDKFLGTKNIKDLKFAYDFGDKRGPLNIQLEKDVIKFGSIASFPWKPKTRKEKRTEELRIATERNARKKAENMAKTAEAERARKIISSRESEKAAAKSENASSLSSIISGIDEENQQNKTYGIARDTKVFEGSDQYKELQKKLALAREERAQQSRRDLVGSTNYNVGDINKGLSPSVYNLGYQRRDVASLAKNQIEGKLSDLRESEFSEPKKEARTPFQERLFKRSQDRPIGVNDEYKAPQAQQQVDAPRFKFFSDIPGTSPQAQRLRMQREERDFNENLNIKIARSQKTKKEPRTPKTESERYNISRKQSAPIQEKTLFDESELSKIGTYQTQEQKLKDQEQKFKDNADKIKRFRDAASESARVKFKLNSRQRRRGIANENLAENLKSLRFASGGLVPGTGNSDTVPMDLPEGSFVIRKSSVNKIGADNLAKASRFASGGVVPALLTPGEYVYSPQEASKIGSSKLHAMNKFAKFARGGPIGLGRSGKFDPNNPDDIKKLKETLEEQLRYEDPNKDESLVQIEVKQNTDEIQKRAQQYTSDENARQQAETTVNSRNALVARQSGRVAVSQQNVNAAAGNVASATTARDSYISEANTQRGLVSSSRQEATRQQARITSLTAGGASATDPRLIAANTALIAATTAEATARNLQARATRNAISANNQVVANTNTLNGLLVTHGQEVRNLTRAENAAATAVQGLEAATIKAEGSAQLLDEYQQDAAGKILLAGKVIGETKPLSGRGSMENALKRKEADYKDQTGRMPGKDEREILKGDVLSEYRASAEKQLRAKSVQSGKPISELNLQTTADQYTREFSEGKRKANYNKQGEIIGDRSLAGDLTGNARRGKTNTDYTAEGDLTSKGKIKDFASRAIFGAKRTDFEAGSEGDQQFKQSRGSSVANKLTMAAVGASFASERIKASGGTVAGIVSKGEGDTVKVDENAASGFKSAQAFGASLSSASTYAATAAQSLAKFGPVVAGVGAGLAGIVGAMEGYHNGIKQAEAEIRDAKIAQALNNLQDIFGRVSSGLLEVNDSTLRKISENQKVVTEENATKAYEESGGNASPLSRTLNKLTFGLAGNDVDTKKFNEALSKSTKETNAAQIGPLTNVLNKYSEQIGKDAALKIKSGGGDIATTNFEDIRGKLLEELRSGGGGAGKEQIAKIASAQDISIADAEKQFIKTLQESFQAEKIKSVTTKSVQENAKAINSMQALSNAVNAAAASADSFSSKLDTNSSLFEGSIGSTKLTSFAEKSGGSTPDFAKFNTAISESAGLLGAYGQEFKNQGNAVNAASQILPDILAQSVANPISGKETATQITDSLKEGLKARGITGAAADQVVSSVGGKVSSEDFTKLLAEAGGDVSKATQKLLSDIRDPLISAFTEIDNKLTEAGNKYISGLEDLAKRQKAIGDQIGRLSDLRGRSRSFAANEIQRLPGVQQGTAESINLQGARNDFSEQQQRLTGFGAGAAENPAAIASRLKNTQQQIRVQEEKVLNTNKSTNGGAEFRNAALELTKLKSQASNLNDALKNLTDQSKKLEAAQAKLAQVRQNIDEKRTLGRRLLTQSPEEQQKMLQGQAIFNQVQARGGSLQGMSTEQNAILFDFLDNFGAAGKKIQDQILDANGYGAGKDDKAEEKALVAEQARIFAQQEEAQRQIIANQQSLQQDYFSNLDSRNEKFYSELQKFTQEMQKNSLIAEKGKEQQKVTQIKDVQKEGKFLGESGFNTKEDFEKLSTYKGSVETLVKNKQETTRTDELAAKAIATNGDIPLQQDFLTGRNRKITGEGATKFEQNLTQNGYKASEAQRIREIAQQKLDEGANKNEVQTLARKQFHEEKSFGLKQEKEQVATVFKGSGIEDKLNNLVEKLASGTEISLDQFNRALASVKELQLGVGEGLSTAAIGAETRIKALNVAINGLGGIQQLPNAEVKPQVSAFAVGGSVFKSRGTDTVPAMLTPGEFVVNRSATQQNLPLLQSINSGKTAYLAEGGIAGYIKNTMKNASSSLEFMNSDEYNEAIKNQKKLNVGSFSEEIRSNANKVNKAKRNKDYFTTENTRDVSDRDILNREFSKGRTPYRVEKSVFDENFLTNSYDWISKLNPNTELGFDQSKVERIGYLKKLYDKDYNSKIAGTDSWKESSDFLKKQTISDSTLFRGIQQASTLGFANSYLTTARFNEALPKTTLYKKYDNVLKSDTDYLGRTIDKINELEEQPNKNKAIIEQARKAFETRRLKEIEDSKKQEDQKNAESKKNEITKKLDTSKETGSIENSSYILGAIAKTKDIEEQKKKLKESGIQDAYVNTGKIFEDVGQSNVDQFIKEKGAKQDNYFLRRKGSPEAIAKIYLQREAQAQAIIGKLELMQSPEYSDDPNSIDPKTAYAVGQEELKNLIDGKETKINKKSLDKISSGQKKIVGSYITMNSFESAATSKGELMDSYIETYGKALNKDPKVFVEKLIKLKEKRSDISGDPEFITAQAQGIFEALMFLDREAKANKVFANRNQIKKGKGLLGVLEEKSEKNIKSFTKFGKLKGNIDDKGLGIVDFGAKDPTEVDFNATNFRTAIPPQSIEDIKKLPSSKNGLDNNLLTALKATPSISNYGYLNFPTVKDDVLLGLEKDGGLFKVNSFPKQDAEGKTTFERQAKIALLENKNTYQQLVEISKQIKGTPSVDLKDPSANVQANLNQNINTFDPNGDPAQQIKQIQKEKQNAKATEAKEAKTTRRDVKNLNKVENPRFNVGQRVPTRDEFQNDTVDLFKNFVELKNTLYRQKSKELIVGQDSDKIVNTDQGLYEGEKEAQYGNNLLASSFKYFTRDPNAQKLDYSIREISAYFPIEEPYTYKLNRYPELLAKIANFYKFGEQTEGSPEYVKSVAKLKNDAEADNKAISMSVQNAKKMEDYYDSLIQQNNLLLEPPTAPTPVGFDPTMFATQNSQIPLAKSKGGIINYLATGGNVPSYRPNPNPSYFKPKGTDTVPAMLSPGEFVINASATAKHGDLLSAINSGQDVGYSATGGLIEYLAYGDTVKSWQNRTKNLGVTPQSMMEANQSQDIQKLLEQSIAIGDSLINEQSDSEINSLEKTLGFKFFKGADANKETGISRVGDAGNYAEGPQGLGGDIQKSKRFQLPKIEELKKEQERPKQRTMPLAPLPATQPPKEPDPTTSQSSDTNEDDIKKKRAAEDEQRQNAKDLKDAKAALHAGGKDFVTNAEVRKKAEEIKRNRELDAQIAIWQAELEGIQNLSKGGIPRSSSDTIPAMLTPGEFVVNARQSSKNASLLHAINTGEDIQGFANGGPVGYYAGGKTSGGRPSDRFSAAANNFNLAVSNFDRAISRMSIPSGGSNNTAQYIDIAKSSFEELSRILKTEIKIGSGPIDKFNNAVTQFGTNSTGFNSGFSSSLEKFKTYVDELNAAINRIPGTLNLEIMGTLNASLNVNFDTSSVYAAVTNATESLKGWITSEIDRQITDEMG